VIMFEKPDAPGRADDAPQFDYLTHLGSLLAIQVKDVQEDVETEYGLRSVIVADVHVIDASAQRVTEVFEDAWLFGTVLFSQMRAKRGRLVLGVLEQGDKRPGKKAPWRLGDATDEQEAAAVKALTSGPAPAEPQVAVTGVTEAGRQAVAAGSDVPPWERTAPPF
jgi:hypothetical protein